MKSAISLLILIAGFALYILGSASIYSVSETEQVIITQFGKPVGETISDAGLHFKTPFIQKVNRFEKRILEWDGPPANMPTRDKVYIVVDNFARWRISDPRVFFENLRDERTAQSRLDDILGSETRNTVAKHELIEIIRTTKERTVQVDQDLAEADKSGTIGKLIPIRRGRALLEKEIYDTAKVLSIAQANLDK
jgi:membrane protease subunit HflC